MHKDWDKFMEEGDFNIKSPKILNEADVEGSTNAPTNDEWENFTETPPAKINEGVDDIIKPIVELWHKIYKDMEALKQVINSEVGPLLINYWDEPRGSLNKIHPDKLPPHLKAPRYIYEIQKGAEYSWVKLGNTIDEMNNILRKLDQGQGQEQGQEGDLRENNTNKITKSQIKQIFKEELDDLAMPTPFDKPERSAPLGDRFANRGDVTKLPNRDQYKALAAKSKTKFEKLFWLIKAKERNPRSALSRYGIFATQINFQANTPKEALKKLDLKYVKKIATDHATGSNYDGDAYRGGQQLLKDLRPTVKKMYKQQVKAKQPQPSSGAMGNKLEDWNP